MEDFTIKLFVVNILARLEADRQPQVVDSRYFTIQANIFLVWISPD
jgi:hypothetical protein